MKEYSKKRLRKWWHVCGEQQTTSSFVRRRQWLTNALMNDRSQPIYEARALLYLYSIVTLAAITVQWSSFLRDDSSRAEERQKKGIDIYDACNTMGGPGDPPTHSKSQQSFFVSYMAFFPSLSKTK